MKLLIFTSNIIIKDPWSAYALLYENLLRMLFAMGIQNNKSKDFSTASKKYWIKKVKNGENYSVTSRCISLSIPDILSSFVTVLYNSGNFKPDHWCIPMHILSRNISCLTKQRWDFADTYFLVQIFNIDSLIVWSCIWPQLALWIFNSTWTIKTFATGYIEYFKVNCYQDSTIRSPSIEFSQLLKSTIMLFHAWDLWFWRCRCIVSSPSEYFIQQEQTYWEK